MDVLKRRLIGSVTCSFRSGCEIFRSRYVLDVVGQRTVWLRAIGSLMLCLGSWITGAAVIVVGRIRGGLDEADMDRRLVIVTLLAQHIKGLSTAFAAVRTHRPNVSG